MPIPAYNPKELHPIFPLCCPCRNCDYYGDPENYITKDGTYPVKGEAIRRQRLKCHAVPLRFSETKYSPLFGHGGTFKEYEQTAKMTGYGLSVAQIADVLVHGRENNTGVAESSSP